MSDDTTMAGRLRSGILADDIDYRKIMFFMPWAFVAISFLAYLTFDTGYGLLITSLDDEADRDFLLFVQHKLFTIGSYLATDQETTELKIESRVTPESIEKIEREIDRLDNELPKMKRFVLPGGCRSASLAHVCRTVCRRAERQIYRLAGESPVEEPVLVFINRLSDYLFVLARKECIRNNGEEIIWDYSCI